MTISLETLLLQSTVSHACLLVACGLQVSDRQIASQILLFQVPILCAQSLTGNSQAAIQLAR